jgi:hypothetical protein
VLPGRDTEGRPICRSCSGIVANLGCRTCLLAGGVSDTGVVEHVRAGLAHGDEDLVHLSPRTAHCNSHYRRAPRVRAVP